MDYLSPLFIQLMMSFSDVFVCRPTVESFITITLGWILCPGRRALTGVSRAAGHHVYEIARCLSGIFLSIKMANGWTLETFVSDDC